MAKICHEASDAGHVGRGFPNSRDVVFGQLADDGVLEIIRDVDGDLIPHKRSGSREYLSNLLQNLLLYWLILSVDRSRKLRQEFALLFRQLARNRDIYSDVQIAPCRTAAFG